MVEASGQGCSPSVWAWRSRPFVGRGRVVCEAEIFASSCTQATITSVTLQKERVEEDGVSEIEFERLLPDEILIVEGEGPASQSSVPRRSSPDPSGKQTRLRLHRLQGSVPCLSGGALREHRPRARQGAVKDVNYYLTDATHLVHTVGQRVPVRLERSCSSERRLSWNEGD